MRKAKFTHLFSTTQGRGYQKAACGAMVNSGLGAALSEAAELAAMCEKHAAWLPPLCPKCAVHAVLAEV